MFGVLCVITPLIIHVYLRISYNVCISNNQGGGDALKAGAAALSRSGSIGAEALMVRTIPFSM
jgi:hypothetical protein